MGHEQLLAMLEKLGSVGVILPAALMLAGIVLLLLGSRLARPMCTFSGLILGGIGGLMIGEALADAGGIVLATVIGAAIAGALLSALLFRLWMAISGALIFGLVAAGAVLLWQAPPDDATLTEATSALTAPKASETDTQTQLDLEESIAKLKEDVKQGVKEGVASALDNDTEGEVSEQLPIDKEAAKKVSTAILDALRGIAEYYRGALSAWWTDSSASGRGGMLLVGGVAAVIGLLMGLLAPYRAASVQSAAAGAMLILFSAFSLLAQLMPEHLDWLPATPRRVLICLGLITAAGLALQWTVFKRKTDK